MKVKVFFFAQLREAFGEAETSVVVEEGMTAGRLAGRLLRSVAAATSLAMTENGDSGTFPLLYAVNEHFVEPEDVLKDGDTLALMTPVSGG